MIIKVCGMRDQENILQLVEKVSPDLMGMIFYDQSPRFIGNDKPDSEFFKSLPVQRVGVFVNSNQKNILQKINDYALDYVQLHGDESLEFISGLKSASPVKIIKACRVGKNIDWQELEPFDELVDLFLFDTQTEKYGGSGKQFDWAVLESYPLQKGFLLSGGVDAENMDTIHAMAIKLPRLRGVDINSKFEIQPGLKDLEKVTKFIRRCRGSVS